MTVKELQEILKEHPDDMEVRIGIVDVNRMGFFLVSIAGSKPVFEWGEILAIGWFDSSLCPEKCSTKYSGTDEFI